MTLKHIAAETVAKHGTLDREIQPHLVQLIRNYELVNTNHLEKLLSIFHDKRWCMTSLSGNPNITLDIVESHPDKNWDWTKLSSNPAITWDIIESNQEKPWDWSGISRNTNITWDIIQSHPTKPWDWSGISCNQNITCDIVEMHIDKPWDWCSLGCNRNIPLDFITSHTGIPLNQLIRYVPRSAYLLSHINSDVSFYNVTSPSMECNYIYVYKFNLYHYKDCSIVDIHLDKYCDWTGNGLSSNPNINWKFVKEHHDKPWDWIALSANTFFQPIARRQLGIA